MTTYIWIWSSIKTNKNNKYWYNTVQYIVLLSTAWCWVPLHFASRTVSICSLTLSQWDENISSPSATIILNSHQLLPQSIYIPSAPVCDCDLQPHCPMGAEVLLMCLCLCGVFLGWLSLTRPRPLAWGNPLSLTLCWEKSADYLFIYSAQLSTVCVSAGQEDKLALSKKVNKPYIKRDVTGSE